MRIRDATPADAPAIARIYNEGMDDKGTFETEHRTAHERELWLRGRDRRHPVLVAERADGAIEGWASLNRFSPRKVYDGVADVSIYVERASRGRGVGRQLMSALEERAVALDFYKLTLVVFTTNLSAIALYRACGYREVGVYLRHGTLDGEWKDNLIMEKLIGRGRVGD
ncbi:MAG: arsinothricin resistance N-acetyltransferase ArsN1 [Dehalococcoidia bacterium]|nr:arsinothricin resistance N-acetyltransferase ArsN1 [Dehalococcoidia bacterium]